MLTIVFRDINDCIESEKSSNMFCVIHIGKIEIIQIACYEIRIWFY